MNVDLHARFDPWKRWSTGAFVLLALLFTVVTPVHAAPRALTRTSGLLALAPAGEQVLVARAQGRNLRVFAIPLSGGEARQVFSFDAPAGLHPESAALAASAQRAALTIEMGGQRDQVSAVQTFGGPVEGGWSELQPFTRTGSRDAVSPLRQQVDGERIFTTESYGDVVRVVVRDPDPREVPFAPGESASSATFAGDLVATVRSGGGADSTILVVRDWRTGAMVSTADLQDGINAIALRPDGRAAVITYEGALYEVRPGASPRRLTGVGGAKTAYAGDSLVFEGDDGLRIIDADGRIRRLGMPTWTFGGFSAAGSRVVWIANGCLLVDDAGAPPAAAPGPGPCLRSEISLASRSQQDLYLAGTLPVTVRCVAAPRACRGALRLTTGRSARVTAISRRVRFSIPAGQTRRLRVPLTCRGYRTMRRTLARESTVIVDLDARTGDGERYARRPLVRHVLGPGRSDPSLPRHRWWPVTSPGQHRRRSAARRWSAGNPVSVRSQAGPRQSERRQRRPLPALRFGGRHRGPRRHRRPARAVRPRHPRGLGPLRHGARSGPHRRAAVFVSVVAREDQALHPGLV